jgi:transposase
MLILFSKYKLRMPINKIQESLKEQYGLEISEGGIQNILHNLKNKFKKKYNQILKEIQNNRVKYGDETGWRINGQNVWCWLFATSKSVLYTIEETRGKGVPKEILKNSNHDSVLVRDDYPGYEKLPLKHQSCWAHLLRNSHEISNFSNVSSEAKELHSELKKMFVSLKGIIEKSFDIKEREKQYLIYLKRIQKIQKRNYVNTDVKKIQTRIINQGVNLITALRYEDVPLTNNYAERLIRSMVVTRKISGGSRSDAGAATHAVNMSIVQTLALKGRSFFDEIKKLLIPSTSYRYLLEKGE